MNYSKQQWWERFQKYYAEFPSLGLSLDLSRIDISDEFISEMKPRLRVAFDNMEELERGAIANPDEGRMVGHYWLRNPSLAPTQEIRQEIEESIAEVKSFAAQIHSAAICGARGKFKNLLLIGIGGSALGPQFIASALGHPLKDKVRPFYFDNTDPDGMERVLSEIGGDLGRTLCLVISKSGGTRETRNGMLEARAVYEREGLDFGKHAVAVTGRNSELDQYAAENDWLKRFPMWDWVGGRTSVTSTVGLLPAALQGFRIDEILAGAKACDVTTRGRLFENNPAAQLAIAWFRAGEGKGKKDMVFLPYKDRLELFSRYLQQLIMESIGKERNLGGALVNQGINVFGNKGSTDQHSYIQQLRDGIDNFFVTFVEVLRDQDHGSIMVEDGVTSGDYLHGFYLGTREALTASGRQTITLSIREVSPFAVGLLIALFERAVGYYASFVNVNAYNQPGVEAGKKAASIVLDLQGRILRCLAESGGAPKTALQIAERIGADAEVEHVFRICEHLSSNPDRRVVKSLGDGPTKVMYSKMS